MTYNQTDDEHYYSFFQSLTSIYQYLKYFF